MTTHTEEAAFTVRIELLAEFGEDYEGDDDGNAWLERWKAETRPRVLRAIVDALRADRSFDVLPTSRGASPDEEAQFTVTYRTPSAPQPVTTGGGSPPPASAATPSGSPPPVTTGGGSPPSASAATPSGSPPRGGSR